MNVRTLSLDKSKIASSVPARERVSTSPVSISETEIVAMAVWFSGALSVDEMFIEGLSLTGWTVIFASADAVWSPCEIVYEKESLPL